MSTESIPDNADWLSRLNDDLAIENLTLPGSHDAGTQATLVPFARTQTLTIEQQLKAGVRCLDIRLGKTNDGLDVYHGVVWCALKFDLVLYWVKDFLIRHPREFVVMTIKKEDATPDSEFSQLIYQYVMALGDLLYMGKFTPLPSIKDLRGKLLILKRWIDSSSIVPGCQLPHWPDNTMGESENSIVKIVVQDVYKIGVGKEQETKFGWVKKMLVLAAVQNKRGSLFFNFTSATGPFWMAEGDGLTPGVNDLTVEYLVGKPNSRYGYGMVLLDFVEYPDYKCITELIRLNPT